MDEEQAKGLETLQVWQQSLAFARDVCIQVLPGFPAEEKWALAHQLRKAVQSIPANIAEEYGRFYYQESVRFCYIARGSLEETFSHLALSSIFLMTSHPNNLIGQRPNTPVAQLPNHPVTETPYESTPILVKRLC